MSKEQLEIVPVTKSDLQERTKKDKKKKVDEKKGDKKLLTDERKFIIDKHGGT